MFTSGAFCVFTRCCIGFPSSGRTRKSENGSRIKMSVRKKNKDNKAKQNTRKKNHEGWDGEGAAAGDEDRLAGGGGAPPATNRYRYLFDFFTFGAG